MQSYINVCISILTRQKLSCRLNYFINVMGTNISFPFFQQETENLRRFLIATAMFFPQIYYTMVTHFNNDPANFASYQKKAIYKFIIREF